MQTDFSRSDDVFRLGWLEDAKLADGCLRTLAGVAAQLANEGGASEADTGAIFVEPLLRGLGWETLAQSQVNRAPRGECPDYELYIGRGGPAKRVGVIEVKRLDVRNQNEYFQSTGALGELRKYVGLGPSGTRGKLDQVVIVDGKQAVRGAVTDGRRWHIYGFQGDDPESLMCRFDLRGDPDVEGFKRALGKLALAEWVASAAFRE